MRLLSWRYKKYSGWSDTESYTCESSGAAGPQTSSNENESFVIIKLSETITQTQQISEDFYDLSSTEIQEGISKDLNETETKTEMKSVSQ